jgi:hypothetical protein
MPASRSRAERRTCLRLRFARVAGSIAGMTLNRIYHAGLACALASIVACATTPHDTLDRYARAVQTGNASSMARLHSLELGNELTGERLQDYAAALHVQRQRLVAALREGADGAAMVTATLPSDDGMDSLTLRFDGSRWGIVSGVGGVVDTLTPSGAVVTLIRALRDADTGLLYTLVPPDVRQTLSQPTLDAWYLAREPDLQMAAVLMEAALAWPVSESETSASFDYGDGVVRLQKIDERWYVLDF